MDSQLFIRMDEEKKISFKSKCASRHYTEKEVINAAVDDFLKKDGKPKWLKRKAK